MAIHWKGRANYQDIFSAGSNRWVAPEMYGSPERYSTASDIFDLGCLFCYVLFGIHPFGEPAECQANVNKNLFRLPQDNDSDPKAIILISKMINANPIRRPTIKEVLSDPYLQQRPVDSFVPHLNSSTLIGRGSYGATVYEYLWNGLVVAVKKIQKSLVPDYKIEIEVLQNRLTLQSPYLIHYYTHVEDFEFW